MSPRAIDCESRNSPVVAGDDHGASSSGLVLDNLVGRDDTLLLVGSTELVGEVVLADSSEVGGRASGENVLFCAKAVSEVAPRAAQGYRTHLSSTGAVLSSSSSDVGDLEVLGEVLVAGEGESEGGNVVAGEL
jgi:hypothetical protein